MRVGVRKRSRRKISPTRERLKALGLRPRKRYGQHFLTSRRILERIAEETQVGSKDTVVEIGAGLGDLTEVMSAKAGRVVAMEVDHQLFQGLLGRFHDLPHVEIVLADALHWPLPDGLQAYPRPRKVVGNLPYNVGTQILMRFIRFPQEMDQMAMMFQKEVAERLIARVGTPAYGGITLMVQVDWEVKLAFKVPPSAFHPRPRVESAFVIFRPLPEPRVELGELEVFVKLVRAAFGHRRKTLRNAFKELSPGDPQWGVCLLKRAGIEASRRGETLTLEEFALLSRVARETPAIGGKEAFTAL